MECDNCFDAAEFTIKRPYGSTVYACSEHLTALTKAETAETEAPVQVERIK